MAKRKALGKGLSALIPEANGEEVQVEGLFQCPIESIEPNPYQPRQDFEDSGMEELVLSVKEKGIITPVLVTKTAGGYRLIAGERRWRVADPVSDADLMAPAQAEADRLLDEAPALAARLIDRWQNQAERYAGA